MGEDAFGGADPVLALLFEQRIEPKISERRFRHSVDDLETRYEIADLVAALRLLRFAEGVANAGRPVPDVLTVDALAGAYGSVESAAEYVRDRAGGDEGIASTIDDEIDLIADILRVGHFPDYDREALRRTGSTDPHAALQALIYKIRRYRDHRVSRQQRLQTMLAEAPAAIERHRVRLAEPGQGHHLERRRIVVKPRTIRGANALGQGALLVIVDIVAAAGFLSGMATSMLFAVQTVASIAGDLVQMADGVDDLMWE